MSGEQPPFTKPAMDREGLVEENTSMCPTDSPLAATSSRRASTGMEPTRSPKRPRLSEPLESNSRPSSSSAARPTTPPGTTASPFFETVTINSRGQSPPVVEIADSDSDDPSHRKPSPQMIEVVPIDTDGQSPHGSSSGAIASFPFSAAGQDPTAAAKAFFARITTLDGKALQESIAVLYNWLDQVAPPDQHPPPSLFTDAPEFWEIVIAALLQAVKSHKINIIKSGSIQHWQRAFSAVGSITRCILKVQAHQLGEHRERRDSMIGPTEACHRIHFVGLIDAFTAWIQHVRNIRRNTKRSLMHACSQLLLQCLVDDQDMLSALYNILKITLSQPWSVEHAVEYASHYLDFLVELLNHIKEAGSFSPEFEMSLADEAAELCRVAERTFIPALLETSMLTTDEHFVADAATSLLHLALYVVGTYTRLSCDDKIIALTDVLLGPPENASNSSVANLDASSPVQTVLGPDHAQASWVGAAWLCKRGLVSMRANAAGQGSIFLLAAVDQVTRYLGRDNDSSVALADFLLNRDYLPAVFATQNPSQLALRLSGMTDKLFKVSPPNEQDLEHLFMFMHDTPSTDLQAYTLDLLTELINVDADLEQLAILLSSFSNVEISKIRLESLALFELVLKRGKRCGSERQRVRLHSVAAETIVELLGRLHDLADRREAEEIATLLLARFKDTIIIVPVDVWHIICADVVELLSSQTSSAALAARALQLMIDVDLVGSTRLLDASVLHSVTLLALNDFCTHRSRGAFATSELRSLFGLLCDLEPYLRALDSDRTVAADELWMYLEHPALRLDLRPIVLEVWLAHAGKNVSLGHKLCNAAEIHIEAVSEDALATFVIDLLEWLVRELEESRQPLLLLVVRAAARASFATTKEAALLIRSHLLVLGYEDATLQQCPRLQEEIQKTVVEVTLESVVSTSNAPSASAFDFLSVALERSLLNRKRHMDIADRKELQDTRKQLSNQNLARKFAVPFVIYRGPTAECFHRICDIDDQTTLGQIMHAFNVEFEPSPLTFYLRGVKYDVAEHADAPYLSLSKTGEDLPVIKVGSDSTLPNDSVPSPRTYTEELLLKRYWDIYNLLYEPTPEGHSAMLLLVALNVADEQHATRHAHVKRTLDTENPQTPWKLMFAVQTLRKTFVHHNAYDVEFCREAISDLVDILRRLDLMDGVDSLRAIDQTCSALSMMLSGLTDEKDRLACLEGSVIVACIERSLQRLLDIQPPQDEPRSHQQLVTSLLTSAVDVIALNDIALADAGANSGFLKTVAKLIECPTTAKDVISCLSKLCVGTLLGIRDDGCRPPPATQAQIRRYQRVRMYIWDVLQQALARIEAFASSDLVLILAYGAHDALMRFLGEDSASIISADLCEVLIRGIRSIATQSERSDTQAPVVAALLHMLYICARHLRLQGTLLQLDSQATVNLQKLLLQQSPTAGSNAKTSFSLSVSDNRRNLAETLGELSKHCGPSTGDLLDLRQILDDHQRREDYVYRGHDREVRPLNGIGGLDNLGQTCYLNSTLQQLYMNLDFRNYLLHAQVEEGDKQPVLKACQSLFQLLQESCRISCSPRWLTSVLGLNIFEQEDAQQFFTIMLSRLQDDMITRQAKLELFAFFEGRNRTQTRGECGHISHTTDTYTNLCVTVKNMRSLTDSLDEYIQGETLEDKFECSECKAEGKKGLVKAHRRTRLELIPDNLIIALKRFEYTDYGEPNKINDQLNIPDRLDMTPYKVIPEAVDGNTSAKPEADEFEIVGVIVHQGTLSTGHYWSYVRDQESYGKSEGRWFRAEDSRVTVVTQQFVLEQTCGSPIQTQDGPITRTDNAYMLFYRRKAAPIARADKSLQGKQKLQAQKAITEDNDAMLLESQLFDGSTMYYIEQLMSQEAARSSTSGQWFDYAVAVLDVAVKYLVKILLHQVEYACVDEFCANIEKLVNGRARLAYNAASLVMQLPLVRYWIGVCNSDSGLRLGQLMIKMLSLVRVDSTLAEEYGSDMDCPTKDRSRANQTLLFAAIHLIDHHSVIIAAHSQCWHGLFALLQGVAQLGPLEARMVAADSLAAAVGVDFILTAAFQDYESHHDAVRFLTWGERHAWTPLTEFLAFVFTNLIDFGADRADTVEESAVSEFRRLPPSEALINLIGYPNNSRSVALVRALCFVCPLEKEQTCDTFPAARLLVQIYVDGAPRADFIDATTLTLSNAIRAEEALQAYTKYIRMIEAICHRTEIEEAYRLDLFRAALHSTELCPLLALRTIKFVTRLLPKLPTPVALIIQDWCIAVLLNPDKDVALTDRMLDFFKDHVFCRSNRDDGPVAACLSDAPFIFLMQQKFIQRAVRLLDRGSIWEIETCIAAVRAGTTAIRSHHQAYVTADAANDEEDVTLRDQYRAGHETFEEVLQHTDEIEQILQQQKDATRNVASLVGFRRPKILGGSGGMSMMFIEDDDSNDELETSSTSSESMAVNGGEDEGFCEM